MKPGEATIRSKSRAEVESQAPDRTPEPPAPGREAQARAAAAAEELELVRRAQGGDEAAFRRLVDRHGNRVYALAHRILRSASDAEEVAQDALVRAWRALPRFRGEASFSSWLHRIVVRQSFDRAAVLKGRRAREAVLDVVGERPEASIPGPDAETQDRAARLERLVARLSEVPRTVVTLYYYHDRSVEEVAKTLHMPENTVKTHLSRARAALRSAWMSEDRTTGEPREEDPT